MAENSQTNPQATTHRLGGVDVRRADHPPAFPSHHGFLRTRELLEVLDNLEHDRGRGSEPGPGVLTPRELEVLRQVAAGHSNRAIADRLSISERTVDNHVLHILNKLGFDSRTAAATWAVRQGLV